MDCFSTLFGSFIHIYAVYHVKKANFWQQSNSQKKKRKKGTIFFRQFECWQKLAFLSWGTPKICMKWPNKVEESSKIPFKVLFRSIQSEILEFQIFGCSTFWPTPQNIDFIAKNQYLGVWAKMSNNQKCQSPKLRLERT